MKVNQANILKIAAVTIAAPRYAGAFGAAIGIDVLANYSWLSGAEVATGGAMALLEGFALAFVLSKWRLLKPATIHWVILLIFVLALALTLPVVALPYLLIEQMGQSIAQLFKNAFPYQVAWSFLVAGVPMLVIMAVGFADVDDYERQEAEVIKRAEFKQVKSSVKQASEQKPAPLEQKDGAFVCSNCDTKFPSQKALSGHMRWCAEKIAEQNTNGAAQP